MIFAMQDLAGGGTDHADAQRGVDAAELSLDQTRQCHRSTHEFAPPWFLFYQAANHCFFQQPFS